MKIIDELKDPDAAAIAGAVVALIVATVIPPAVLLAGGAATVGGVYLYNWKFRRPKAMPGNGKKDGSNEPAGETIDAEPVKGGEEK